MAWLLAYDISSLRLLAQPEVGLGDSPLRRLADRVEAPPWWRRPLNSPNSLTTGRPGDARPPYYRFGLDPDR